MNKTTAELVRRLKAANDHLLGAAEHHAAIKEAIAALSATSITDAVGEVTCDGVVGVTFYENCNYGCNLPVGTKVYLAALPQQGCVKCSGTGWYSGRAEYGPCDCALPSTSSEGEGEAGG